MKIFRIILGLLMFIGVIMYTILVQNNYVVFDETISNILYGYIFVIVLWFFIESVICDLNNNKFLANDKSKCKKENKNISEKVNDDLDENNDTKIYCVNCHREIYSSNYTGSNLCVECKNYYYKKEKNN